MSHLTARVEFLEFGYPSFQVSHTDENRALCAAPTPRSTEYNAPLAQCGADARRAESAGRLDVSVRTPAGIQGDALKAQPRFVQGRELLNLTGNPLARRLPLNLPRRDVAVPREHQT